MGDRVAGTHRQAGRLNPGCRLEICHDKPGQDMSEWETEFAFKLAD